MSKKLPIPEAIEMTKHLTKEQCLYLVMIGRNWCKSHNTDDMPEDVFKDLIKQSEMF